MEIGSFFLDWNYWQIRKEIIVNSLDLMSFVFITPELFHMVSNERLSEMLSLAIGSILTIWIGLYLISVPLIVGFAFFTGAIPYPLMLLTLGPLIAVVAGPIVSLIILGTGGSLLLLRPYAFGIGVALFLVSRLFALAISIHEIGNEGTQHSKRTPHERSDMRGAVLNSDPHVASLMRATRYWCGT